MASVSSFIYHPSLVIGIGELGNRTLAHLHDTLPQHEPFVQMRGFHRVPAKANTWSYALDMPHATPAVSRADVREQYLWHLQQRQAPLFEHLHSAVTHLKETAYVYFFTDLQDPLSALLLDIVHLVRHILTQHNPKMAIRLFIYVATPPENAYEAAQFATLREWLRFSYAGIDNPQYLFHPSSPFAFLNNDHTVLFNRLFLYQPHPQLAQLWAEIGVAQLQNAPSNIPDQDVYSRSFIEHDVSNFSSTAQMKRITLTRDIQALSDESLLMCSAYVVYSIGLPKTYLHHTWRMSYATRLIQLALGVAHPDSAFTRAILHRLNLPAFVTDILNAQLKPLGQLSEKQLHTLFMSPDALSLITDPTRQPVLAHPSANITSVTDFIGYYANQNALILGDIYATEYPTGAYANALAQCATITVRDVERTIHRYLVTDLNAMLTDETDIAGGVTSALAWLGALHGVFTRLYKEATWITELTRTQLQQADALAHTQRQQLIGAGHLTRMGRLSQMAEMYRDSQVRDIQLRGRYDTLCFVQHLLRMLIARTEALSSRLFEMKNHLQALLDDLAQRQARLKRPQSSDFCLWIHDEAWETDHANFLWRQFGATWRSHIAWSLDEAMGQVMCRVGRATVRLSSQPAQTLQIDHWLDVVDIQHEDTLWQMYAQDALRAKSLADSFKKMIDTNRYRPLEGYAKAEHHLMLPFYTPNETGATTFLAEMTAHTRFSRAMPYITPSGDKIMYLTKYEEQPLQFFQMYKALAEKYRHFADPAQHHHLFTAERTAKRYEALVDARLFAPPIVDLFADEGRLNLFVLLHALDYVYEQSLDDTMRYLGVQVTDPPLPLTIPSHDPSWYDAAYTFVWRGYFFTHPTQPIRYDELQDVCDKHINTHIKPSSRPHWRRIHLLNQTRPSRAPEIHRLGLLLDVYLGYQDRLNALNWGQSRLIADLHGAFLAVALARIDELQSDLGRFNL